MFYLRWIVILEFCGWPPADVVFLVIVIVVVVAVVVFKPTHVPDDMASLAVCSRGCLQPRPPAPAGMCSADVLSG